MGDRSNVVVVDGDGGAVWLYSHSRGPEAFFRARAALAKKWQWNDASYLTRIVYDAIVGNAVGTATSFGISTTPAGSEYNVLAIYVGSQSVEVYHNSEEDNLNDVFRKGNLLPMDSVTFEVFSAMSDDEVRDFVYGKRVRARKVVVEVTVDAFGDEAVDALRDRVAKGLFSGVRDELSEGTRDLRFAGAVVREDKNPGT